jgi:hypothetical protein
MVALDRDQGKAREHLGASVIVGPSELAGQAIDIAICLLDSHHLGARLPNRLDDLAEVDESPAVLDVKDQDIEVAGSTGGTVWRDIARPAVVWSAAADEQKSSKGECNCAANV